MSHNILKFVWIPVGMLGRDSVSVFGAEAAVAQGYRLGSITIEIDSLRFWSLEEEAVLSTQAVF